jgi:hypothetical protein
MTNLDKSTTKKSLQDEIAKGVKLKDTNARVIKPAEPTVLSQIVQGVKLKDLLRMNLRTVRAYLLAQQLLKARQQ